MDKDSENLKEEKSNGNTPMEEETELMNSESKTPLKTPSKEVEVKFKSGSINGDAKVDIEGMKASFAGMSKDELLKYVNDPFWVKVRTSLFILFWLIWIGMFAAAIAIIVMAPRCALPTPRKWHEKGPIVEVSLPKNGKSLMELSEKIDHLVALNTKGIILSSISPSDASGNPTDLQSVSGGYGTLEDLKQLLALAKKKAIRVLLNLVPNHTSLDHPWFNKSVSKEEPFKDFYVWAPGAKTGSGDGTQKPPNNWSNNLTGESAWTWHPVRNEFYLHQFDKGQPDLNFNNPKVLDEYTNILSYWLDLGISGFNFDKIQYLVEDPSLENEDIGDSPDKTLGDYGFWDHKRTFNRPEVATILASWQELTYKKTERDGIIVITGNAPIASNMNQTSSPDLIRPTPLANPFTISGLQTQIERRLNGSWAAVEAAAKGQRVANFGDSGVDVLNSILMLMPGTPITQLGDELGLSAQDTLKYLTNGSVSEEEKSNPHSHYSIYKTLAENRDSQSVLYGDSEITVVNNTALVLARWKANSPGFVLVWNSSPANLTLDLSHLQELPAELTVIASADPSVTIQQHVPTNQVLLPSEATIVFTFAPPSE